MFYSGYTEEQLISGHEQLVEKLTEPNFSKLYVCKKYANKKFLKASVFAVQWAKAHAASTAGDGMVLEHWETFSKSVCCSHLFPVSFVVYL